MQLYTVSIPYFSAKATALAWVRLPTAYSFLPIFCKVCAISLAITPVPSTAQFKLSFMVEPSYGVSPTAGQPRRLFIWPHYTVQGGALQWGGEARQIQKIPAVANSREEKYKMLSLQNFALFPTDKAVQIIKKENDKVDGHRKIPRICQRSQQPQHDQHHIIGGIP